MKIQESSPSLLLHWARYIHVKVVCDVYSKQFIKYGKKLKINEIYSQPGAEVMYAFNSHLYICILSKMVYYTFVRTYTGSQICLAHLIIPSFGLLHQFVFSSSDLSRLSEEGAIE